MLRFSRKIYLLLQFSEYGRANGFFRKLMILRKKRRKGICHIFRLFGENGARNDHCRPKMKFFAVSMATEYRSADSWQNALPRHALSMYVKFHRDRISSLGAKLWTDKQTHKQKQRVIIRVCKTRQPPLRSGLASRRSNRQTDRQTDTTKIRVTSHANFFAILT